MRQNKHKNKTLNTYIAAVQNVHCPSMPGDDQPTSRVHLTWSPPRKFPSTFHSHRVELLRYESSQVNQIHGYLCAQKARKKQLLVIWDDIILGTS